MIAREGVLPQAVKIDDVAQHRRLGRRPPRCLPRRPGHLRHDHSGRRLGQHWVCRSRSTPSSPTRPCPTCQRSTTDAAPSGSCAGASSSSSRSGAGRASGNRPRRLRAAEPLALRDLQDPPFAIKTTEATHFRRVAIRRMLAEGMSDDEIAATSVGRGFGIRDGNGIMFISHDGNVYPSGFLPRHDRATSGATTSSTSTGTIRSSLSLRDVSTTRAAADAANTSTYAAARVRARMHGPATSSSRTPSARTSRGRGVDRVESGPIRRRQSAVVRPRRWRDHWPGAAHALGRAGIPTSSSRRPGGLAEKSGPSGRRVPHRVRPRLVHQLPAGRP